MEEVTRQDATRIAEDHLRKHPRPDCVGIREVVSLAEIQAARMRRPQGYGLTVEALREGWIAYVGRPAGYGFLGSADIVVVSRGTGEVLYSGPAGDEG